MRESWIVEMLAQPGGDADLDLLRGGGVGAGEQVVEHVRVHDEGFEVVADRLNGDVLVDDASANNMACAVAHWLQAPTAN